MRLNMRSTFVRAALSTATIGAVVLTFALVNGNDSSPAQNGSTSTSAAAPDLPSRLPVITDEASTESTLRELVKLAATHAVGAPREDRNPEIVVTSESACGVKVKVITCPSPENPQGPVKIYINPTVAWQQFQQPEGHAGGDVPVQNAALGSVAQYLAYRDMQRNNPDLLKVSLNSDPAVVGQIASTIMCKNGQIYGGLHGIMNGELARMWQANNTGKLKEWFAKGYNGEC